MPQHTRQVLSKKRIEDENARNDGKRLAYFALCKKQNGDHQQCATNHNLRGNSACCFSDGFIVEQKLAYTIKHAAHDDNVDNGTCNGVLFLFDFGQFHQHGDYADHRKVKGAHLKGRNGAKGAVVDVQQAAQQGDNIKNPFENFGGINLFRFHWVLSF